MNHDKSILHRHRLDLSLCAIAIATAIPATADVRLPNIFTDNMMLQRDQPVRVWGWADAGEAVSVDLSGKSAAAKADDKGRWAIALPALKTGENLELTVKGNNSLTLKNVIIGDIWVCSGQSNMELALNDCLGAADDIKAANLPKIRRIKIGHVQEALPQMDVPLDAPWQVCAPETAGKFTSVGFYFAREILTKTGVPIGLVDANWGATRIEKWIPAEGLELVDELKPQVIARQEAMKAYRAQLPKALSEVEAWIAKTRSELADNAAIPPMPVIPPHPDTPVNPYGEGWCTMYNAMIHPVVHLPIKGALWYQGESNGNEGATYYDKMRGLIGGWRKQWGQGDFPFYFVQLAPFQDVLENPAGGNDWTQLREAQRKSLTLPNTGMAVTIDTVPLAERENVHPRNKYDVGLRLALWALNRDYGLTKLEVSGPLFKALRIEGNKALLAFDHTGSGLMVGKKDGRSPALEDKQGKLRRFALAGADKTWHWAEAVIENNTVVVSSPEVKEPVAVRYAYQKNPDGANLFNRDGLPASPFRTDAW